MTLSNNIVGVHTGKKTHDFICAVKVLTKDDLKAIVKKYIYVSKSGEKWKHVIYDIPTTSLGPVMIDAGIYESNVGGWCKTVHLKAPMTEYNYNVTWAEPDEACRMVDDMVQNIKSIPSGTLATEIRMKFANFMKPENVRL